MRSYNRLFYLSQVSILVWLLLFCNNPHKQFDLNKLQWLEGNWSCDSESGFSESWQLQNDRLITGIGFTLENGDTLVSEALKIFTSDSGTYYQAVVYDQNDEKSIHFKLVYLSADSVVFSNPAHDFPKYIVYKSIADDLLRVHVCDGFGADSKGFKLSMTRHKVNQSNGNGEELQIGNCT